MNSSAATSAAATAVLEMKASQSTPFYGPLHNPEDSEEEEIYSNNVDEELASTWSSFDPQFELILESDLDDGSGECAYIVPNSPSFVKAILMVQFLPALEVIEDNIRAAWTPNLAYAIVENAVLHIGAAETHPIDKHYIAIYNQHMLPPGMEDKHEKMIGNRPSLTDFTKKLPQARVGCAHPFFFYHLQNTGLQSKSTQCFIHYSFLLRLKHLIRCQKNIGTAECEEWVSVPYDDSYFTKKIDSLNPPQVFALSSFNGKLEMSNIQCTQEKPVKDFYITDVFKMSSKDPTSTREQFSITRQNPTKCLFTVLENVDSSKNNVHCNYTAHPTDYVNGPDPADRFELVYDLKRRRLDRVDGVLNEMVCMETFDRLPWRTGFHAMPLCEKPFRRLQTGVILGHETIKAALKIELNRTADVDKTKFTAHTYMLILRRLRYRYEGADAPFSVEIL